MIVVSDTGPLNYLVLIDHVDVLQALYTQVIVPRAVLHELQHPDSPVAISQWLTIIPDWIEIRDIQKPDSTLAMLDRGEQEAITLAVELSANGLLIDERKGRRAAEQRGLVVTGTLGILEAAADQGLLELEEAMERLQKTSFRASKSLFEAVLRRHR